MIRKLLLLFLGLFFIALLINKLSSGLVFDRTSYETPPGIYMPFRSSLLPFLNYDGRNYLDIALFGYTARDKMLAFFPLYPLLVRIFSLSLFINPIIVGLLISITSAFFGSLLFYKLIELEYSKKTAQKSLLLLLFFPSSVYFFAFYPEGLFFLLTILCFWYIRKKNLLLASIFAALATATRLIGIALIPVLIYEGYLLFHNNKQSLKFSLHSNYKKIPWTILISPLGFLSFGLFIFFKFGSFFYIFSAQTDQSFGRTLQVFNPALAFFNSFMRVLAGPQKSFDNIFVYPVIILEFVFGVFEVIVLFLGFRKIETRYWIYMFFSIFIVLLGGVLSANVRNLLVVFPIYIILALRLGTKTYYLWLLLSFLMLILINLIFLKGYWIA